MSINRKQSYTIMDAMAGVEYAIELRAKDEFDGHWSTWSKPVYASSWTGKHTNTERFRFRTRLTNMSQVVMTN